MDLATSICITCNEGIYKQADNLEKDYFLAFLSFES